MTIIGEKTADAELIYGVSSAVSSVKNFNNFTVIPKNQNDHDDHTLEGRESGQYSDKENNNQVANIMQRK
jgi:hypothetical protein